VAYLDKHGHEIFWAAVFFAAGWIIDDLLKADSRIRKVVRRVKNALSERSVTKLEKRIADLKRYRARLSSEKGLYLTILSNILAALFLMCMAGMFAVGEQFMTKFESKWLSVKDYAYWSLVCLGLAAFIIYHGLRATILDDENRFSSVVKQLHKDIAKLEVKLAAKRREN
jgi:hypothetical protein